MSRSFALALTTLLTVVASTADAADWSQFRGDSRDGTSAETGLMDTWGEGGPPEIWRRPIGPGYSGLTVVGDRLYTMDADDTSEYLAAFDAASGEELWRQKVGDLFENDYGNGPRSTPTYADGVLYVMSSLGQCSAAPSPTGLSAPRP
jgi:outer membrane protein assembly factor BamB